MFGGFSPYNIFGDGLISPEEAIVQASSNIMMIRWFSRCGGMCPSCRIHIENEIETVKAVFDVYEMMETLRAAANHFASADPFGFGDDVIDAQQIGENTWTTRGL